MIHNEYNFIHIIMEVCQHVLVVYKYLHLVFATRTHIMTQNAHKFDVDLMLSFYSKSLILGIVLMLSFNSSYYSFFH